MSASCHDTSGSSPLPDPVATGSAAGQQFSHRTLPDTVLSTRLAHYAQLLSQFRARTAIALLGITGGAGSATPPPRDDLDNGEHGGAPGPGLDSIWLEARRLDHAFELVIDRIEQRGDNPRRDESSWVLIQRDIDELCLQIGWHHRLQELIRAQSVAEFAADHDRRPTVPAQTSAPAAKAGDGSDRPPRHLALLSDTDVATLRNAWSSSPSTWPIDVPPHRPARSRRSSVHEPDVLA